MSRVRVGVVLCVLLVASVLTTTLPVAADIDATPARLSGPDRYATAAALAEATFPPVAEGPRARVALVARGDEVADALAAAGLAGALNAPVLLVAADEVPMATRAALERLGVTEVVVLGGPAAISDAVVSELRGSDRTAERVAGSDRYATAAGAGMLLAETTGGVDRVLIAAGRGGADALVAGSPAAATGTPILLVGRDAVPDVTREAIIELAPDDIVVVGGSAVISDPVVAELAELGTVRRIAGATREATAVAVADALTGGADGALVVRGDSLADALGAGPAAARMDRALLLASSPDELGDATRARLAGRCDGLVQVAGGRAAINDSTMGAALRAARLCGADGTPRVRLAVAAPDAAGASEVGDVLRSAVADPRWWGGRRLDWAVTAEAPDATVRLLAPDAVAAAHPLCRADRHCRVADDLLVNQALWDAPPPGWARDDHRTWVLVHLVGRWLGVGHTGCVEGTSPATASQSALEGCAPNVWPLEVERADLAALLGQGPVVIAATGDVHGERVIASELAAGRNPFRDVAPIFAGADITMINLETAVGTSGSPEPKEYTFQAPPALLDAAVAAGVDVVSLANNHALDYGVTAMFETINHARARGLAVVGAGRNADEAYAPALFDVGGTRVAVVGLSRVLSPSWAAGPGSPGLASAYDDGAVVAAVQRAAAAADHVVVMIHWGVERADCPDAHQVRLARLMVDAGADLVVGHHPHVLQGIDARRDDAVVAMSLGNFVWYHDRFPSNQTGVLVGELDGDRADARLVPAVIGRDGAPRRVEGDAARAILDRVAARRPGGPVCGNW